MLAATLMVCASIISTKATAELKYTITPKATNSQYCIGTDDCYDLSTPLDVSDKSDIKFMWQSYFEYKLTNNTDSESTQLLYLKVSDKDKDYVANLRNVLEDCVWTSNTSCSRSKTNNSTNSVIINAFEIVQISRTKVDSTKTKK